MKTEEIHLILKEKLKSLDHQLKVSEFHKMISIAIKAGHNRSQPQAMPKEELERAMSVVMHCFKDINRK